MDLKLDSLQIVDMEINWTRFVLIWEWKLCMKEMRTIYRWISHKDEINVMQTAKIEEEKQVLKHSCCKHNWTR